MPQKSKQCQNTNYQFQFTLKKVCDLFRSRLQILSTYLVVFLSGSGHPLYFWSVKKSPTDPLTYTAMHLQTRTTQANHATDKHLLISSMYPKSLLQEFLLSFKAV